MEFNISDIHSLDRSYTFEVLAQIARVEKKAFPTNETFGFSENFWRKKPKMKVLYVRQVQHWMHASLSSLMLSIFDRKK